MLALVDTPSGRRMLDIRGRRGAQRAADLLFRRDLDIVAGLPPLFTSGTRYCRERDMPAAMRQPYEVWMDAERSCRQGLADCEDLAAWRAAELVEAGIDEEARPLVYPPRPRLLHVIVVRGDGTVEDPSAQLGMRRSMVNGVKYRFGKNRATGLEAAGLTIPMAGESVEVRGYGTTRAAALRDALARLEGMLAEIVTSDLAVETGEAMDLGTSDLSGGGGGFGPRLTGAGPGQLSGLGGGAGGAKSPAGGGGSGGGGFGGAGGAIGQGLAALGQLGQLAGLGGGAGGAAGSKLPAGSKGVTGGKGAAGGGPKGGTTTSTTGLEVTTGPGVERLGSTQREVPAQEPIIAPSVADKLDLIRELADMSKSGDLRHVQDAIRRGGPIGKLARELVRGVDLRALRG